MRERTAEEESYLGSLAGLGALRRKKAVAPKVVEKEPEVRPQLVAEVVPVKPDPMLADDDMLRYSNSIAKIESGGNYGAVGPDTGNGRAYGKYQVMDFNVGPWTREVLGTSLSPQQFLADKEAQEKVFRAKFGESVRRYGNPQDAASVWFTGRPLASGAGLADVNKMTGSRYVDLFNRGLASFQGGGVVNWFRRQFGDDDSPERSWDMDPPRGQLVSDEEAQEARRYKTRYGNSNERDIINTTEVSQEPARGQLLADRYNENRLWKYPAPKRELGWDRADRLYANQMMANTSPIAALGFDPEVMSLSDKADITSRGGFLPSNKRIWAELNSSTPVHESIHRGYAILRDDPEAKKLINKWDEEVMTRAEMIRRFGPSAETDGVQMYDERRGEKFPPSVTHALKALERDDYRKALREIDKIAHRKLAERIIEREGGVR